MKNKPGPLAPTQRPSRKITPRSYSCTMRNALDADDEQHDEDDPERDTDCHHEKTSVVELPPSVSSLWQATRGPTCLRTGMCRLHARKRSAELVEARIAAHRRRVGGVETSVHEADERVGGELEVGERPVGNTVPGRRQ